MEAILTTAHDIEIIFSIHNLQTEPKFCLL